MNGPPVAVENVASPGAGPAPSHMRRWSPHVPPPPRDDGDVRPDVGLDAGAAEDIRSKRNNRGSICQKLRRETNMFENGEESRVSMGSNPTNDSSLAIKPIRSSFWSKFRPLKIPSRRT